MHFYMFKVPLGEKTSAKSVNWFQKMQSISIEV